MRLGLTSAMSAEKFPNFCHGSVQNRRHLVATYRFAADRTENVMVSRNVASATQGTSTDAVKRRLGTAQLQVIVDNKNTGVTTMPGTPGTPAPAGRNRRWWMI